MKKAPLIQTLIVPLSVMPARLGLLLFTTEHTVYTAHKPKTKLTRLFMCIASSTEFEKGLSKDTNEMVAKKKIKSGKQNYSPGVTVKPLLVDTSHKQTVTNHNPGNFHLFLSQGC